MEFNKYTFTNMIVEIAATMPIVEVCMHFEKAIKVARLEKKDGTPKELFEIALSLSWDIDVLKKEKYQDFLQGIYWQTVKDYKIFRSGYKCENCDNHKDLHVHHLTYQFKGRELYNLGTLQVLCADCHKAVHDKAE